jgi:hypothetical protein
LTPEQDSGAEEAPEPKARKGSSKKGHTYQKGKSCIQLGGKHNYKMTPSGKSMRCTKCGSTRWVGKAKKAKKGKGKKSAADNGNDTSDNESQQTES